VRGANRSRASGNNLFQIIDVAAFIRVDKNNFGGWFQLRDFLMSISFDDRYDFSHASFFKHTNADGQAEVRANKLLQKSTEALGSRPAVVGMGSYPWGIQF
jgi:hypothetical protein